MALTITGAQVNAWTALAQNTEADTDAIDLSGSYASHLAIDIGLTSATAHTGTRVIVDVSSYASTDEFWTPLVDFITCVGTANEEAITNNPLNAGEYDITVASTTGYTTVLADGGVQTIFLLDATVANSEILRVNNVITDSNIYSLDVVTRTHQNTAKLYSIAASHVIEIPFGIARARVIIDNTYDIDGSSVAWRVRKTTTTALT